MFCLAALIGPALCTAAIVASAPPAGAASAPSCFFTGTRVILGPIVADVQPGTKIHINCSGLPTSHPFLLLETSLTMRSIPLPSPS